MKNLFNAKGKRGTMETKTQVTYAILWNKCRKAEDDKWITSRN